MKDVKYKGDKQAVSVPGVGLFKNGEYLSLTDTQAEVLEDHPDFEFKGKKKKKNKKYEPKIEEEIKETDNDG